MKVNEFLEQYAQDGISTVYLESSIWKSLPNQILKELREDIDKRKDRWDWIGTDINDNEKVNFAKAFTNPRKLILFWGPYGEVEFKERK